MLDISNNCFHLLIINILKSARKEAAVFCQCLSSVAQNVDLPMWVMWFIPDMTAGMRKMWDDLWLFAVCFLAIRCHCIYLSHFSCCVWKVTSARTTQQVKWLFPQKYALSCQRYKTSASDLISGFLAVSRRVFVSQEEEKNCFYLCRLCFFVFFHISPSTPLNVWCCMRVAAETSSSHWPLELIISPFGSNS